MKLRASKTLITTLGLLAAVVSTNSLFAQQTGYPSVLIDGVRYVPVSAQGAATVAPASAVPASVVVIGGSGYSAPAPVSRAGVSGGRQRSGHVDFGPGFYILKPKNGDSMTHYGATFGGGFTVAPSEIGQVRFDFNLGVYGWSKAYSYSYVIGKTTYANSWRESSIVVPLLANAGYEFNLGSPHFRVRAGVVIGETTFVYNNGDSTASAGVFSYGPDFGFTYTPRDTFYLDLNYRFLGNSDAKFNFDGDSSTMQSSAQQVRFSVGWRF